MDTAAFERVATALERLLAERDGSWQAMAAVPCNGHGAECMVFYSQGVAIPLPDGPLSVDEAQPFPFKGLGLPAPDSDQVLKITIHGRAYALYSILDVFTQVTRLTTIRTSLSIRNLTADLRNTLTAISQLAQYQLVLGAVGAMIEPEMDTLIPAVEASLPLGECLSDDVMARLIAAADQPDDDETTWRGKPPLL